MAHIHVIHENDEWTAPLLEALRAQGLQAVPWHLAAGVIELAEAPPPGVFYNRMSASSHTRGHRFAPELTSVVLAWLEHHDACVVNSGEALRLELSKVAQYAALESAGISTPRTVAAVGEPQILAAARRFDGPFITKHNRAGKGLGVHLFHAPEELEASLALGSVEPSVDGVMLVQAYIEAPEPFITRVEFVGQELLYAVRVDTSEGFELCPADFCEVGDVFCPAGSSGPEKFEILTRFEHPLVDLYRRFLRRHGVHVAAFEFIQDAAGRCYTYDINTNTNYNARAEARAGVSGMRALARYLAQLLSARDRRAA
jgi:hypothetical protein